MLRVVLAAGTLYVWLKNRAAACKYPVNSARLIRVPGASDAPALRLMLGLFSDAFDDPESYLKRQPSEAYLTRLLASDTFIAVAAFVAGQVVGGLAGFVLPRFEQERSELCIYDLAIAEDSSRQGISTELIETIKITAQCGLPPQSTRPGWHSH